MKGGQKTVGHIYHEAVQQLKTNYFQYVGVGGVFTAMSMVFSSILMAVFFAFYFVFAMLFSMAPALAIPLFMDDYRGEATAAVAGFLVVGAIVLFIFLALFSLAALLVGIATATVGVSSNKAVLLLVRGDKLTWQAVWGDFKKNWKRYLGISAWSTLWTLLWSLLFYVPGVIKSLSYSMAPYLVIENPDMTVRQALKKSMEITEGHKGKLFLILLIQIGFTWAASILASFGIMYASLAAAILWILPFYLAMMAIAYLDLKQAAIEKGLLKDSCQLVEPTPVVDYQAVDGTVDASHKAAQPVQVGVPASQAAAGSEFTGMEEDSPQL